MKVSVSVTTFNHEQYIAQALDGILMQEADFEFEIVVGDDHSSDRTREIIEDYERRNPDRVRALLATHNMGAQGKRIFAETLSLCRGEYIATMDGDDYWTSPHKLKRQVEVLDADSRIAMCYHNVMVVHEDGSRHPEPYVQSNGSSDTPLDALLQGSMVASCSPMSRRDVLVPLPNWYFSLHYGDWPLALIAGSRGTVAYIDEVMGVYRVHPAGMWSGEDTLQRALKAAESYEEMTTALGLNDRSSARRTQAHQYFRIAREYSRRGALTEARRYAWRSLRAAPFHERTSVTQLVKYILRPIFGAWSRSSSL